MIAVYQKHVQPAPEVIEITSDGIISYSEDLPGLNWLKVYELVFPGVILKTPYNFHILLKKF